MKNPEIKIIFSAIIFLSVIGFVGTVNAAGASLYVSPTNLTENVGDIFSASVGFIASGDNICAVEGTLVFNNLSCQNITVVSDVVEQSSPTCSNPHFLIGIPNCTTLDKNLLTVSLEAGNTGVASISFTGVDIMGEGASVGSASTNGNYTINAVLIQTPKTVVIPRPTTVKTPKDVVTQPTQQVTQQPTQQATTPTEQMAQEPFAEGQQASLVTASPTRTITIVMIVLLAILVLVIGGGWYMYSKKKKK